ncbi:MAG: hypothetical protein KC964_22395 [Candidatus Omnitrophica bacterium]|nr:hypothetical protein [Candidatus Omnitrophota bacterium]MCA9443568.1 hypothetical protein [Candidatus Omnitrophota bacterium]
MMPWKNLLLLLSLACSLGCSDQASKPDLPTLPDLPVLKVDATHDQIIASVSGTTAIRYVIPPGRGFVLDATDFTFNIPRNAPLGVQAPNSIQVLRRDEAMFSVVWSENKRNIVTGETASPNYGSGPFQPFAAGDMVIIGIGHLRPATSEESGDVFVPFWCGLADVQEGS